MAINPLIALQNQRATPNIQPALNQLVEGIRRGPALDERKTNMQANRLAQAEGGGQEQIARIGNRARFAEQLMPALQSGNQQQAQQIIQQFERMDPQAARDASQMLQRDPQGLAKLGQQYIDVNRRIQASQEKPGKIGSYNPRDYTTESWSQFVQSRDPAVLERYESQRTVDIGGVPHRFDPSRGGFFPARVQEGGGQPRSQQGGGRAVTAEDVGESKRIIAASEEAGKSAIKQSNEAIEQLGTVRQNISVLDEGISAIDEGAETGPIYSRLPSVRESSIKLDNVRGRLGLDVIGGTTFGALSESELKFALDTAIPRNLGAQELKDWLQRKKQAQEKLSRELENAAIFLGKPGNTPAEYLEMRRQQTENNQQDQGGQQGAEVINWEDLQ